MLDFSTFQIVIIITAYLFTGINGFQDGSNIIATIVTSRTLTPKQALVFACIGEFIGAVTFGTAVALTIGQGIINVSGIDTQNLRIILFSALLAGITWNMVNWLCALPASSSHALIGGMVGACIVCCGISQVLWKSILFLVILPLFLTPIIGIVSGYICMKFTLACLRSRSPGVNEILKKIQVLTLFFLSSSHGSNDAQKTMGIITIVTASSVPGSSFSIEPWVVFSCGLAISLGISLGGWKVIKTVGQQIYRLLPLHSFNSQLTSGLIIQISSFFGFPVSTSHVVGSTIMGTGAGYQVHSVKWNVAKNILKTWLITLPATIVISAVIASVMKYFIL